MAHLVVDAMNVIGSRPTGWWRDRDAAVRGLLRRLRLLAAHEHVPVTLVVDGHALSDVREGPNDGVEVLYASRPGPNAADDRIVEYVAAASDPSSLDVVTSDRGLSERVRASGARVSGPQRLLEWLDRLERAPESGSDTAADDVLFVDLARRALEAEAEARRRHDAAKSC